MEAVSAVVEATVATAWVDAVAVWRVRRVGLDPVAAKDHKGKQSDRDAGCEQQT
jgi:hypothetical protein